MGRRAQLSEIRKIRKKTGDSRTTSGLGSAYGAEIIRLSLWGGDMLILSSDGAVRDETEDLIRSYDGESVKELAASLVQLAESAGGEDDMTAAVLRLDALAP